MPAIALRPRDLSVLQTTFQRYPWIHDVRLFGSRTSSDARRDSDVDLAISAPDATASQWMELVDAIESTPIIHRFDILRLEHVTNSALIERINQEGLVIFPEIESAELRPVG